MNRKMLIFWTAIFLATSAFFDATGLGASLFLALTGPLVVMFLLSLLLRSWSTEGHIRQFLTALIMGAALLTPLEYLAWHALGAIVVAATWLFDSAFLATVIGIMILVTAFIPVQILLFLISAHLLKHLSFFAQVQPIDLASVLALASALILHAASGAQLMLPLLSF